MTELTRRHLLAGAAAIAANPLFASLPAFAAAPPAGTQAPGFYRYKVGSIEITVVTDGVNRLPVTDEFVTNVKKEDVKAAPRSLRSSTPVRVKLPTKRAKAPAANS